MRRNLKLVKVVCILLACVMVCVVGVDDAMAAKKHKSWVSRDGKTLYRATVTTAETDSVKVPLTMWQEKPKNVAISLAVTAGVEQSMSATGSFGGEVGCSQIVSLSASIGYSVSTSVSYSAQHSYNVDKDNAAGDYRVLLVWPGAKVHGKVTSEPNGNGNEQIMGKGNGSRLNKVRVVTDKVVKYAPSITDAKIKLDYRK